MVHLISLLKRRKTTTKLESKTTNPTLTSIPFPSKVLLLEYFNNVILTNVLTFVTNSLPEINTLHAIRLDFTEMYSLSASRRPSCVRHSFYIAVLKGEGVGTLGTL